MQCKLCRSNNVKKLFYSVNTHGRHLVDGKDRFVVAECQDCGLVFLPEIIVNGEYYKKYYKDGYYDQTILEKNNLLNKIFIYASRILYKKKEQMLASSVTGGGKISILDIGCGSGLFLSQLDPEKFEKTGIEINKEGCESCRKKGITVFDRDISEVDFGGKKFDLVSLWHVLEHVTDPLVLFENIKNNLKDEGIVVFQMPNTGSLGFRYGRQNWFHMDSPRHLMLYNIKSVKKLCDLTGFKISSIRNEFYDYPLDLFWSIRKSKIRFLIFPFYPFFKIFSREHLTFICKKK